MSRASQGPSNRNGSTRARTASRPSNRTSTGREADRIKATRSGWASPTAAVTTLWRSGPLPLPLAGVAAGLWAALTGLVVTVVLTLVVWIFAAGESASETAMRVGADLWLAAHGTPFVVGDGVWTLLPWAWIVFPSMTLWAAGRWVAHRAAVAYPKSLAVGASTLAAGYAAVALLTALFGTLSGAAAVPSRAALHAGMLALIVSALAMAWRANLARDVFLRAWRLVRPTVGALATMTIGACIVLATSLVLSHAAISESLSQLRPGLLGGVALFVAWLGYLPAALLWSLSLVVGTGVNVGGEVVSPLAPLSDRVDLMGLQMLPTTAQAWWLIGVLIPVAGGVVLSRLAGPTPSRRDWMLARAAGIALVLIALDVWWAISVGSIGAGRLNVLGPPPTVIAVVTAAVALGILLELVGTWAWHRWHNRNVIDLTDGGAQDAQPAGDDETTRIDGGEDAVPADIDATSGDPESPPDEPTGPST